MDAAIGLRHEEKRSFRVSGAHARVKPIDDTVSRYYLRLCVDNRPGVLAQVAAIIGHYKAGISSVIQPETAEPEAELVMMIEKARYGDIRAALREISELDCTRHQPTLLRVETLDD